jgi:antitoxin HigA-1
MARTPIHPGEILAGELEELGLSPTELSRQIRVPANRISQIINGKRAVTGDTALRLAHWFGTSPQFWRSMTCAWPSGKQVRKSRLFQQNPLPTLKPRPDIPGRRKGEGRHSG